MDIEVKMIQTLGRVFFEPTPLYVFKPCVIAIIPCVLLIFLGIWCLPSQSLWNIDKQVFKFRGRVADGLMMIGYWGCCISGGIAIADALKVGIILFADKFLI